MYHIYIINDLELSEQEHLFEDSFVKYRPIISCTQFVLAIEIMCMTKSSLNIGCSQIVAYLKVH